MVFPLIHWWMVQSNSKSQNKLLNHGKQLRWSPVCNDWLLYVVATMYCVNGCMTLYYYKFTLDIMYVCVRLHDYNNSIK